MTNKLNGQKIWSVTYTRGRHTNLSVSGFMVDPKLSEKEVIAAFKKSHKGASNVKVKDTGKVYGESAEENIYVKYIDEQIKSIVYRNK